MLVHTGRYIDCEVGGYCYVRDERITAAAVECAAVLAGSGYRVPCGTSAQPLVDAINGIRRERRERANRERIERQRRQRAGGGSYSEFSSSDNDDGEDNRMVAKTTIERD